MHVRDCFKWIERDEGERFLRTIVELFDRSSDANCILSELDDRDKIELKSSWIVRWARTHDSPKLVLIGEQIPFVSYSTALLCT